MSIARTQKEMVNDWEHDDEQLVFESDLGWMAARLRGEAVRQLSFGHVSPVAAARAIAFAVGQAARRKLSVWQRSLVKRLQRYAEGMPSDFCDLRVEADLTSDFRSRVLNACRKISYGETMTYGELAVAAGHPRAARAVGNCMAGNCVPLIIPCHRVVRAGGDIGPYSAAEGSATKRRLLEMEAGTFFSAPLDKRTPFGLD